LLKLNEPRAAYEAFQNAALMVGPSDPMKAEYLKWLNASKTLVAKRLGVPSADDAIKSTPPDLIQNTLTLANALKSKSNFDVRQAFTGLSYCVAAY